MEQRVKTVIKLLNKNWNNAIEIKRPRLKDLIALDVNPVFALITSMEFFAHIIYNRLYIDRTVIVGGYWKLQRTKNGTNMVYVRPYRRKYPKSKFIKSIESIMDMWR